MRKISTLNNRNKNQRKLCSVLTAVLLGLSGAAFGADGDGDTIDDSVDNCLLVANTAQRDSNGDGYGNRCDGDLTGNGVVDYDDVNRTYWYFGTEGDGSYNPDADIDGDGVVNGTDANLIKAIMNSTGKPGPSAIDYAGSDNPPTFEGTPAVSVTVGDNYSFTPTLIDVDGDELTLTLTSAPTWLTLNVTSGELAGIPQTSAVGSHSVSLSLSDGQNMTVLNFSIEVMAVVVGDDNDGDGFVNQLDNCIEVANPNQRDTNNNGYGNFCDGDLTGNGVIDWSDVNRTYWYFSSYNPDADINGDGVVNGTDVNLIKAMMYAGGELGPSGTVTPVNEAPVISGNPTTSLESPGLYSFVPQASDVDGDALSFSINNQPTWLAFDVVTGSLTGTASDDDVGVYSNIVISVSDSQDVVALPAFSIEVTLPDNGEPPTNEATEIPVPTGLRQLYMSVTGTDNSTCDLAQPCRTFVSTVALLQAGDELILLDGTYTLADHGGLNPVDSSGNTIPNSISLPSGISTEQPTIVRAQNAGQVSLESGLRIGRSSQKVQFLFVSGITFHQKGAIYNGDYNVVTDSGFEGGFSIGTIDHAQGNSYNHVEDLWIWTQEVRIKAINYRANHNTWRRVIIRDDGCSQDYCGEKVGNDSVGITVYNSHHVDLINVVVIDRILGANPYGYGDFATAQHDSNQPAQPEGELLGNNQWLGCMSLNSEASALVFEADAVTTGTTATIRDFVTLGSNAGVYLDPAHRPYSGISVFDVDNVDSYPSNNVANAFSIGCSVVGSNDPGCAHSTANIATGQYTGNMSTLLPINRYNSSEALWPWVNEAQIKRDMCVSVNRGFCSFEGTLSEYIHSL